MRELAQEAGIELDDALVTLWDAGFPNLFSPEDHIGSGDLNRARRALGLATRRELKSVAYWRRLFKLSGSEFSEMLSELGVHVSPVSIALPPKCVSRLRKEARRRGIDPITGGLSTLAPVAAPLVVPEFEWRTPGQPRELRWLSEEEVLAVHYALVEDFATSDDPVDPPGVRSSSLLGSAVFRPQTGIGELLKYPTVETSAAALLHSLIQDHAFHNGNKRSAIVAMLVFLDENGFMLTCHEDELFRLVLLIAQHRLVDHRLPDLPDREVLAIADWLHQNVRPVEVGDRPLPWRKLRRILSEYNCELSIPTGVGNRINITRRVTKKMRFARFGKSRTEILKTQVFYGSEGREAERNTIKKIREALHLDDLHGVDSYAFYALVPSSASDFIAEYRKTLRRLARL